MHKTHKPIAGGSNRLASLWLAAVLTVAIFASGCASGPQTGVRADYGDRQLSTVAIAPFYARGNFGMADETVDQLRAQYESRAAQSLRSQGFEVIDAGQFRNHLAAQQAWESYDKAMVFRQPLTAYFEPSVGSRSPSIHIRTLRQLQQTRALPADAILYGEVVYHTQGTCRGDSRKINDYAQLTVLPTAPQRLPRPCITSHFQAKLVDAQTGHTMWFNRSFWESHSAQLGPQLEADNIMRVVNAALSGDGGVAPLAPDDSNLAQANRP